MNRCTSKPFLFNHSSLQETEFVQRVFLTSCFTFLFVFVWCRFVRRLLYFYKPSSKLYAGLALDHLKARQLTVVGCQFVEFLMDSDEVREVYTDARTLIYFFFLVIYEPTFVFDALFSPPRHQPGWPGLPGGPGEGHGIVALLVLWNEARALSAE